MSHRSVSPSKAGRRIRLGLLSLLCAGLLATTSPSSAQAQKCQAQPERRALDFWIGTWQVVNSEGEQIATSVVSKSVDGCALQEEFSAGAVTGHGTTYYDASDRHWHVLWVDSLGRVARYRGTVDGQRVSFEGEHVNADGSTERARRTLERRDQNETRYGVELSVDDGATWSVAIDGAYLKSGLRTTERHAPETDRRASREDKAEITATAPLAVATTSGSATATTAEADLTTLETGTAQVHMTSPMTVRLPLGPVEKLARGYAWSSTDTAPFTCQGASVRQIRVSQDQRGKKVRVSFELALHSTAFSQKVRLDAVLLDPNDGSRIGETSADKVPIGRGSTAQANDGHITRELFIEVDGEVFERVFGAANRPELELTLTQL